MVTEGDEHRLRQVRRARRGSQVQAGSAGRADHHHRVGSVRVLPGRPVCEVLGPDLAETVQRDALQGAHLDEHPPPQRGGQRGHRVGEPGGAGAHGHATVILAPQEPAEGADHVHGRVEVGDQARHPGPSAVEPHDDVAVSSRSNRVIRASSSGAE